MPRKINVYFLGKVYFVFRCKVVCKYLLFFFAKFVIFIDVVYHNY